MITAKEAFNRTHSSINSIVQNELSKIEVAINNAIKKGQYSFDWSGDCSEGTREELTRLGYVIKQYPPDPRDWGSYTSYNISWKKA